MDLNAPHHPRPAPTSRYPFDHQRHATASQTPYPYAPYPVQQNHAPPHPHQPAPPLHHADTWAVGQTPKTQLLGRLDGCTPRQPAVAPDESHPPSATAPSYAAPDWSKFSTSSEYYQIAAPDTNPWCTKDILDMDYPNMDPEMPDFNVSLATSDEDGPIDLRQYAYGQDADFSDYVASGRRYTEFSMSSAGIPDCSMYEDMPSSEAFAYTPSETSTWSGLEPPSNHLSPINSPRNQGSARATHSPSSSAQMQNVRTSPYSAVDSNHSSRWSTGTSTSTPRTISQGQDRYTYDQRSTHHSYPSTSMYYTESYYTQPQGPQSQQYLRPSHSTQQTTQQPQTYSSSAYQLDVPRPLPSQSQSRLPHPSLPLGCSAHFADASPPDLYATLLEPPSDPPDTDFHPTDPDMMPKSQELRYEGDLYVPKWVRGSGNKREGWCGFCKPGRWLVLKNSAFWYDKSFTHGVSAQTGAAFKEPGAVRRAEGSAEGWEGLCGGCGEWVALVSSKKKGTTWFRHAYKCHTHPKVRDAPKRRRGDPHRHRGPTDSGIDMSGTSISELSGGVWAGPEA